MPRPGLIPCKCGCGVLPKSGKVWLHGHHRRRGSSTKEAILKRFFSKVEKTDDCWLWIGGRGKKGYGFFKVAGTQKLAHRVSYELFIGNIPEGLMVCHTCDNPPCIKPEHLFAGTAIDNAQDKKRKGREGNTTQTIEGRKRISEASSKRMKELWKDKEWGKKITLAQQKGKENART